MEAKAPPEPEQEPAAIPPLDEADPELDDDDMDDEDLDKEAPEQDPNLPRLHTHGSPDPRPLKAWLIKHVILHLSSKAAISRALTTANDIFFAGAGLGH